VTKRVRIFAAVAVPVAAVLAMAPDVRADVQPTVVSFDKFGEHTWAVPEGVRSVRVDLWGGGGGGAGGTGERVGVGALVGAVGPRVTTFVARSMSSPVKSSP
jgi:hypothetical protein